MSNAHAGTSRISMLVVTLLLACVLVQNGYQTFQIMADRDKLAERIAAQEATVQDGEKVRAQLLSIAGQTALLAEQGNANAVRLIEVLRDQGVVVRPPGAQ
jgi:cell division protein FtsL